MKSLFWRIFLWFWVAMVLVNLASVAITYRPVDPDQAFTQMARFMRRSLALEGKNAATLFELQGPPGLQEYLRGFGPFWQRYLLDESGEDLTGQTAPESLRSLVVGHHFAGVEGLVQRPFLVQPVTSGAGRSYLFAAEMRSSPRSRGLSSRSWLRLMPMFENLTAARMLAMLAASALVCLALSRYLTAPIVKLRAATRELSRGNLQVRVGPEMAGRRDESALLARDFDRMAAQIESLLQSQSRLLQDVSHELRSPLARLQVALELARAGAGAQATASLDRIEREASRLNDLIGQLLMLARLESGAQSIEDEEVDLAELVDEVTVDADFEAKSRGSSARLVQSFPCRTLGSRGLLRSAVENIVRNAVRFTPEGSAVEVSLVSESREGRSLASIEVRDRGPGVPTEQLQSIFEPFQRGSVIPDGNSESHGLGLGIARRCVLLHGGTIEASNLPEGGLCVRMRIPISNSPSSAG